MKNKLTIATFACSYLLLAAFASAETAVTGTYSLNPSDPTNSAVANGDGTYTLTASFTPPATYTQSYVEFLVSQPVTFSQLVDVNAVFSANAGDSGAGGGSPRIEVYVNTGSGEAPVTIYLGDSPNFTQNLSAYSGVNLIGNDDAGRYDLSLGGLGGSPFTTYDAALALVGSDQVEEIDFDSDTYSGSRNLTLDSINADVADAPEPGTFFLLGLGSIALTFIARKRNAFKA